MSVVVVFAARPLGVEVARWVRYSTLANRPHVRVLVVAESAPHWWSDTPDAQAFATIPGVELVDAEYAIRAAGLDANALLVSCLTNHVFTGDELAAFTYAVNLHPAPLPEYRGRDSYAHAIANHESSYAVTLHELAESVDAGAIIARHDWALTGRETAWELYGRAQVEALNVFRDAWAQIKRYAVDGDLTAKPLSVAQDEARARTYYRSDLEGVKWRALYEDDAAVRALDFPPFAAQNAIVGELAGA